MARRFSVRTAVLLVLALLLLEGVEDSSAEEDYLERCCEQGTRWAEQKLRCEKFAGDVLGVARDEQPSCLEAVDICCRKAFQDMECVLGKQDARAGKSCQGADAESGTAGSSALGVGDFRHDCCEGCKLGIASASSGKACARKKFSLGAAWDPSFVECCNEAKTSSSASTAVSSTATSATASGTAETSPPGSGEFDFYDDGGVDKSTSNSTFDSDDLCKLLKGLLCSEICVPTPGSYYCECREGSVLQEDGRTCVSNATPTTAGTTKMTGRPSTVGKKSTVAEEDKNKKKKKTTLPSTPKKPRTTRSLPTEDNELNLPCPTGYRFNASDDSCNDIDECAEGSHNCGDQKCYNLPGSFQCAKAPLPVTRRRSSTAKKDTSKPPAVVEKCNVGYRYDASRGGCVDTDECTELADACSSSSGEVCVNTPGSYSCSCRPGFRRDESTGGCVDVNECLLHNECLIGQRCDNTIGSYACVRFLPCGTGYTLNAATEICEDDDECVLSTHDCGPGYHCRNTLGSYRCDRNRPGATTARSTARRTTQKTTAHTVQRTTAAPKIAVTQKPIVTTAGYTPTVATTSKPTSTIRPTVVSKTPLQATTSTTTTTTTTTTSKKPDLAPTSTTSTTEPVPTVGTLVTSTTRKPKATTTPRPRTDCPRGFEAGALGQCIDIDECRRNLKMCGSQRCVNTLGSFRCELKTLCGIGYAPDRLTGQCHDVNECAQGTHKCGPEQTCENRPGGYVCYCPAGFEVGASHSCVDIDECKRVPGLCGSSGHCVNTPGSYSCSCKPGFQNEPGRPGCTDVDECQSTPGICQQECYNTWGGHRCGCRFGYNLRHDNRTCEDVDECTEFKDNNLCIGICDNTPGSYACKCPEGYRLGEDGRTCMDIDECSTGNVCKHPDDLCMNLKGGFRCNRINCPPGYVRDRQRINRCMRESLYCQIGDHACIQRPAHFTYNYIGIVSMYPIPVTTGQVELFTMRGSYNVPNSSVRFSMALINARAPPNVLLATEACFALRQPFHSQAVLVLTKSLQGPQDVELELSMEIYGPNNALAGSAVAKIYIIVTQYEY